MLQPGAEAVSVDTAAQCDVTTNSQIHNSLGEEEEEEEEDFFINDCSSLMADSLQAKPPLCLVSG